MELKEKLMNISELQTKLQENVIRVQQLNSQVRHAQGVHVTRMQSCMHTHARTLTGTLTPTCRHAQKRNNTKL